MAGFLSALFLFVTLCTFAPAARCATVDFRQLPDFPIVGYNFLWCADAEIVREQAAMGLTIITVYSKEELDWCQANGIKGICYEPALNRYLSASADGMDGDLQKYVTPLKSHPAFYCLQLSDEPSKRVFDGYSRLYDAMKKATDGKKVYTNLFPNWSQPVQHGYTNYHEYLEAFCALYRNYPEPLLVFDNYRNMEMLLRPMERIAAFCTNLADVQAITRKYGDMPFWATVSVIAHDYNPDPTEADLNFEVFCSLAYGARGIGYFTTVSHPAQIFQGGPFNTLGDKTPMWLWLRDINYRVRRMAPILNTLKSTGVFIAPTVKDSRIFARFPSLPVLPGAIVKSAVDARNDASLLVGEFRNTSGEEWVMLVNLNLKAACNVQIQLAENVKLHSYNSYLGKILPVFDPWLRPGQGKLYKVIKGK